MNLQNINCKVLWRFGKGAELTARLCSRNWHSCTWLRFGALGPGRWLYSEPDWANWRCGGGDCCNHYYVSRRTVALSFFFILPCSRVGLHIPLALLSGLFPAAAGFCQPLPHCPGFLCSPAPTMAFFPCLFIYMCTFCPCVFCLFCSAVFFFLCLLSFSSAAEQGSRKHTNALSTWFLLLFFFFGSNLFRSAFVLFRVMFVHNLSLHRDTHQQMPHWDLNTFSPIWISFKRSTNQ